MKLSILALSVLAAASFSLSAQAQVTRACNPQMKNYEYVGKLQEMMMYTQGFESANEMGAQERARIKKMLASSELKTLVDSVEKGQRLLKTILAQAKADQSDLITLLSLNIKSIEAGRLRFAMSVKKVQGQAGENESANFQDLAAEVQALNQKIQGLESSARKELYGDYAELFGSHLCRQDSAQ